MKTQIKRLAPHQNGKVLGVLMAVITLPIYAVMMIPMAFVFPKADNAGNPIDFGFPFMMFVLMPIIYLVFTYVFVAFGCWLYNKFYKILGGFELEFIAKEAGSTFDS